MDCIYIALFKSFNHSKRFYNTSQHSPIHTHIHTPRAGDFSTKSQPAHQQLMHTFTADDKHWPIGSSVFFFHIRPFIFFRMWRYCCCCTSSCLSIICWYSKRTTVEINLWLFCVYILISYWMLTVAPSQM